MDTILASPLQNKWWIELFWYIAANYGREKSGELFSVTNFHTSIIIKLDL